MLVRTSLLIILWACNACLYLARTNITVAVIWMFPANESVEGTLLAAFYWGYLLSQVPGGYLATRFGAKLTLSSAVCLWSLSTLATGFVGKSVPVLFALRVAVGLAEGANYPSQMQLISKWIPHSERSRAWSFVVSGEAVGTIIALVLGPFAAQFYGWQSVFWISGSSSLVWLVLFVLLTTSLPEQHPRITAKELAFIEETKPRSSPSLSSTFLPSAQPSAESSPPPWGEILTNKRLLFVVATHCCYNFGYYVCLSWIQKFFAICYHANYNNLGVLSVLPYIAIFFCLMVAGNVADRVEIYFNWSATTLRKVFNTIGMGGAGFFFFLLSLHAPTHIDPSTTNGTTTPSSSAHAVDLGGATTAAVLLACAVGIGGFASGAGYWVALGDLSTEYSSICVGISNSVASIPGIVGGNMVGSLLTSTQNDWSLVFQIAAGVEVLGAVIFLVGGSAEDQQFGKKKKRVQGEGEWSPLVNVDG